jgi:hypothetical protein
VGTVGECGASPPRASRRAADGGFIGGAVFIGSENVRQGVEIVRRWVTEIVKGQRKMQASSLSSGALTT